MSSQKLKDKIVSISLEPAPNGGIKVKWESTVAKTTWSVPGAVKSIKEITDRIRKPLLKIVDAYVSLKVPEHYEVEVVPILRDVAQQGRLLQKLLFDRSPTEVTDWLMRAEIKGVRSSVVIKVSPKLKLHAPWSLMFSRPGKADKKRITDSDLRTHFWGIKHRLATIYQTEKPEVLFPLEASDTDRDSILCCRALGEAKVSRSKLDKHIFPSPYHAWQSFFDDRAEVARPRCLYLFCHSESHRKKNLVLLIRDLKGNDARVEVKDFSLYANLRPQPCAEIIFFNSCSTARFQENPDWLTYTWLNGLRGFIGAEVEIPINAAWRFGRDFLTTLFSGGKTVLDTMEEIRFRSDHWPLALLYGIYADPEFELTRK